MVVENFDDCWLSPNSLKISIRNWENARNSIGNKLNDSLIPMEDRLKRGVVGCGRHKNQIDFDRVVFVMGHPDSKKAFAQWKRRKVHCYWDAYEMVDYVVKIMRRLRELGLRLLALDKQWKTSRLLALPIVMDMKAALTALSRVAFFMGTA